MHPPFIAVTWPGADAPGGAPPAALAASFQASGWTLARSRDGLRLWQRPERPIVVSEASDHLLIGHWHGDPRARGDAAAPGAVGARERARGLCRHGWGAYLALLHDGAEAGWWAFRDPSGAVEALTWTSGPYRIVASSLMDLPAGLLPHRMALDWAVVAEQLRRPVAQFARSALRDLVPIAPGDLQALGSPAETAIPVWRPTDHLPVDGEADPEWPGRLTDTVQAVVARLLAPYDRVVCEASGGLDSSIVTAAALRAGLRGKMTALHYVGDRPEADERAWVERLCGPHGLPLACLPLGTGPIDPERDFAPLARDARPPYAAVDADRDRDTAAFLAGHGAQALVTGKGGDAVFFQMPSAAVLADLWRARGLAAARHPRHAEVAHWLRRSVWSLWREGLADRPEAPPSGGLGRLAGRGLGPPPRRAAHPWLAGLDGVPPGKRLQIEALASSQLAVGAHRRGRAADIVQPLLSQPVMELCLSIPSWELVRGGRDRGLAREAFAAWLPEPIVRRRSKGNLTAHYARRTAASAGVLRAHLLDGVLVDAGLLDRRETEAALAPDSLIWRADGIDLIGVAAVESWARYWQTRVADTRDSAWSRR